MLHAPVTETQGRANAPDAKARAASGRDLDPQAVAASPLRATGLGGQPPMPPRARASHQQSASLSRGLGNQAILRMLDRSRHAPIPSGPVSTGPVLQRQCDCGASSTGGGDCAECERRSQEPLEEAASGEPGSSLQRKPDVSPTGDPYPQARGRASVPAPGPFARHDRAGGVLPQRRVLPDPAPITHGSEAPPIVQDALRSPSQPLDGSTLRLMEARFGVGLGDVRVHNDALAAQSARSVHAEAFTVGNDLVFASGKYSPHTGDGQRLIAHELAHVIQQGGHRSRWPAVPLQVDTSGEAAAKRAAEHVMAGHSAGLVGHSYRASVQRQEAIEVPPEAAVPRPVPFLPAVRRQADPAAPGTSADERANDPNFLMCLALCELGIPPSLWRTVVNDILRAVSQEYRDRLGDLRGSQEFESWRAAFTVMSTFNKLKAVVGFLGESRIGPLTIERPAAQAIRRAVLARLAERGLEAGTIEVASQIIRKVALAIEVAIALGCTEFCGVTTIADSLREFSTTVIGAITSFINLAGQLGAALGRAITRPILVAQASLDPANWDISALPARSQGYLQVIGGAFRLAVTPDSFLASLARPLNSYNDIAEILTELAADINTTLQRRSRAAQLFAFTGDFIGGLTPLQFIDILKDYRLLSFVQDPGVLADQQQAQQGATPP